MVCKTTFLTIKMNMHIYVILDPILNSWKIKYNINCMLLEGSANI